VEKSLGESGQRQWWDGDGHRHGHRDCDPDTDANLFIADGQDLYVLNADGSEILTKNYGSTVSDVEVRSDGVYVDVGSSVEKYTKSGF
jgi:hypothetical protein